MKPTKKTELEVFKVYDTWLDSYLNGDGIPKKILDKIFHPFFTTKPTEQDTGLGLSMSYDIVTKGHGGELTAASEEGAGTTSMISLPIKQIS